MSWMIGLSSEGAEVLEEVQGVSGSVPSDSDSAHNDLATALSCPFQMPENKPQLKGILTGSRLREFFLPTQSAVQ
jgi:hypothetical protein